MSRVEVEVEVIAGSLWSTLWLNAGKVFCFVVLCVGKDYGRGLRTWPCRRGKEQTKRSSWQLKDGDWGGKMERIERGEGG